MAESFMVLTTPWMIAMTKKALTPWKCIWCGANNEGTAYSCTKCRKPKPKGV